MRRIHRLEIFNYLNRSLERLLPLLIVASLVVVLIISKYLLDFTLRRKQNSTWIKPVVAKAYPYQLSSSGTNQRTVRTGLSAVYDRQSKSWNWFYARELSNGCQQLLLRDVPVWIGSDQTVQIELMTYNKEKNCSKPAQIYTLSSGIRAAKESKFQVVLDGQKVWP